MPVVVVPVVAAGSLAARPQHVLRAGDLGLRPWLAVDAPAVAGACDDPAIGHWHARSVTEEEAAVWIRSWSQRWSQESGAGWAITDGTDLLGSMSLRTIDLAEGLAEVAYWVLPAARGRSVAPRALGALSTWGFDDLELHRLELAHSTQDSASCRVAAKAGSTLEGTKRRQALHSDGWHDMHLHALLGDDPR